MIDYDALIASLPDPTKDVMPPPATLRGKDAARARADKAFKKSLLDTKTDTERMAKYILEGRLFSGSFRKDGDWVTFPNGRRVYQKKVSDFIGSVPYRERPNAICYVEVKGISPGGSFAFSRLDRSNNPKQPSQHEKLTKQWERGDLVWLFIGWWDSDKEPIMVQQGSRQVRKWHKADCEMTGTLLRWEDWLELYQNHGPRSIGQKGRVLLDKYRIYKDGNRWTLDGGHWWVPCL